MRYRMLMGFAIPAIIGVAALGLFLPKAFARGEGNPFDPGVIYVTSQDLYFDTFAPTTLPPNGMFQLLYVGPNGPTTDAGPGDVGYLGGRWKMSDGMGGYKYFLCPLMGPGREMP